MQKKYGFFKVNKRTFIFKDKNKVDKIFTTKEEIAFDVGGNIDFYNKETGCHLSGFSESDFKNFISERYNGDENLDDYIENWEDFFGNQETKQELFNRVLNNFEDKDFIVELMEFDAEDYSERYELEEAINDYFDATCEIIYCADAMKYLAENDNSLQNSLELAYDIGFHLKDLNSEKLASLLLADNCKSFISKFLDKLEEEGYFETEE